MSDGPRGRPSDPQRSDPDEELPHIGGDEGSPRVPWLARIPVERWYEVLAPLPHDLRRRAARTVGRLEDVPVALRIVTRLEFTEPVPFARRAAASAAPALPDPGGDPARETVRQLSFRLRPDDFAVLREAARLHGTTPAHLARVLAERGARRALADAEDARERTRRR